MSTTFNCEFAVCYPKRWEAERDIKCRSWRKSTNWSSSRLLLRPVSRLFVLISCVMWVRYFAWKCKIQESTLLSISLKPIGNSKVLAAIEHPEGNGSAPLALSAPFSNPLRKLDICLWTSSKVSVSFCTATSRPRRLSTNKTMLRSRVVNYLWVKYLGRAQIDYGELEKWRTEEEEKK